jgi:hypothetical protein
MTRTRRFAALAAAMVAGLVVAACAVPSGGVAVGLGRYTGQIGPAPVTYYYDGTAGEHLNVAPFFSHYDLEGIMDYTEVVAPGGTVLIPVRVAGMVQQVLLPTTGRYQIVMHMVPVDLTDVGVKNYTLALSHDEDRGAIGLGVLPAPTLPGQQVTYTYAGTAGERLNVAASSLTFPDGTVHPGGQILLPESGTYVVTLGWVIAGPGALSHDLVGGPVTLGHTSTPSLLQGQHVVYSYDGTAGEALGLEVEASQVTLLAPSGTQVTSCLPSCPRFILPEDGTYTISTTTTSHGLWLTHDRDDGAILPGTTSATGLMSGQSVSYTYSGSAGETLRVYADDNAPGVLPVSMLTDPAGNIVAGTGYNDGTRYWSSYTLPTGGTYRLVVTPRSGGSALITDVVSIP